MEILFEDKDIIVIVKPVGVLSQKDEKGNESLIELLNEYLDEKGEKADIHVVHRLDKNVGGVMVYAKNSFSASKLSSSVQKGEMIKEYIAAVHGAPGEQCGYMADLLFKDSRKNKSFVVKRERKGVKKAKLYYETVRTQMTRFGEASLVKIRLFTGRTHQIRVQFSSRKMPLIGDMRYGGGDKRDIALWSHRITLRHPSSGKEMIFEKENSFEDVFC